MSSVAVPETHGFSRSRRLKTDEISSVFNFKCREVGGYLCTLGKPNGLPFSRLAVIVGKKAARRAVMRNIDKRVIRETFRAGFFAAGLDIVVQVRKGFPREVAASVRQELLAQLNQLVARCDCGASKEGSAPCRAC